ncbi:heavy-metal-associated domain-containing protein [Psychrobacter celer]|uniref:heavy-metal-associated domain-containing protein n=1 Tax=Psychrobacter celer TaxID=306572 RepID=UPI0018DF5B7A|nr:heavy-metal-associated domain-containing protein [Psychrobacter celer]
MKLLIANMNCGGCARGVTAAIQNIDSKAKVKIDLAAKVVSIETIANIEQMTAALAKGGFPAQAQ